MLTEEAKIARRLYMKRWREQNKENVKKHQSDYWERKAAELQGQSGAK